MAGARLRVDVTGLAEAEKRLSDLEAAGHNLGPVMTDIGEYLVNSTKDRFKDETAPDGTPWKPLSEATKKRKRRNRNRILTRDGYLHGQLAYQAAPTEVVAGSPMVYAGTHQFGAEKGSFGETAKGTPIPWGDIPAREFLGLSDGDRDHVEDLVRDFLLEKL